MDVDSGEVIGYAVGMAKIAKSEVVPGLLVASARYSDVLVLSVPSSRGMVACQVFTKAGDPINVSLPYQTLRWT